MPAKNHAFVDRKCQYCNGTGLSRADKDVECGFCHGTGLVGSYEEVPDIRLKFNPTPFSENLRNAIEGSKTSFRMLASYLDIPPSRLSELEKGYGQPPTPEEENKIREWIG